ncbi:nucleotidyltransferase family protein [Gelidibacter gilvus]|uniref:Nucleotidyltransferase n=1 Tax=Gelidibacter gilvus TaxID=59602 RepID=A0A4Q0XNV9_9FLAO|nr:nucleotidyltransferase domain-containing protein [Gelidibacter gilvus]RXJ52573.1 nucleotidyltransferase [Gelidibacter gilvus]
MSLIEKNIDKIVALCKKYKVSQLFVFGSILNDNFKSTSDIDLLVDFSDVELYNYADNYFDFKISLEKLLKRKIDLLENKSINNPYLRKSIDSSKQMIYG